MISNDPTLLRDCLTALRQAARVSAAKEDMVSVGGLTLAGLQVAMAVLLEARESLPDVQKDEFLPALSQLRAEAEHLGQQLEKLKAPKCVH